MLGQRFIFSYDIQLRYLALPIIYIETTWNIHPYVGTTVHIKRDKWLFESDKWLFWWAWQNINTRMNVAQTWKPVNDARGQGL